MKTKSFAFAILRILTLWILVNYIVLNLLSTIIALLEYNKEPNFQNDFFSYQFIMPLFLLIFWSIVSWFLWFKADRLSNKLIISETVENSIESFDAEKFLSVALIVLGFYFILHSIPILIGNLLNAFNYNPVVSDLERNKNLISIANPIITLFIGLFCVIQTKTTKRLFNKLQKLGS